MGYAFFAERRRCSVIRGILDTSLMALGLECSALPRYALPGRHVEIGRFNRRDDVAAILR